MKILVILSTLLIVTSCGIQQNLTSSLKLSPGMTKSEVEKIMGMPIKSDFKKNVEEWHYCKTGIYSDEFISLFFFDGKLVEKLNYSVTIADTRGVTGSCENFIKMGNYREPDKVIELRMR